MRLRSREKSRRGERSLGFYLFSSAAPEPQATPSPPRHRRLYRSVALVSQHRPDRKLFTREYNSACCQTDIITLRPSSSSGPRYHTSPGRIFTRIAGSQVKRVSPGYISISAAFLSVPRATRAKIHIVRRRYVGNFRGRICLILRDHRPRDLFVNPRGGDTSRGLTPRGRIFAARCSAASRRARSSEGAA